MRIKGICECVKVENKESKQDEGSFYVSHQFVIDGQRFYLSEENQKYEPGKRYIITGDCNISGQKIYLNIVPFKMEKLELEELNF